MRSLVASLVVVLMAVLGLRVVERTQSTAVSVPTSSAALHLADDSTIVYKLIDASVPPEFHRSVTITVKKDTTNLVVDSYGDVLADKSVDTPADVWAMLDAGMPEAVTMTVPDQPKGCTGGTGRSLDVTTAGTQVVNVEAEFCGGSNSGLDTRIDAWIAPARALFPATDELAPTGS